MFQTFKKSGKRSKMKAPKDNNGGDHSPSHMYAAAEFGGGRPDGSRRLTNNYGKTPKLRGEVDMETGNESRQAGRMFNWIKGDSY